MKTYDRQDISFISAKRIPWINTPRLEYFSTKEPKAPLLALPKLLLSRTRRSNTLETSPSRVFLPISSPVIVPSRAPSRAASASSAELRIDNVPTYDKRVTSSASASGRIVAPVLVIDAVGLALGNALEIACDFPFSSLVDMSLSSASLCVDILWLCDIASTDSALKLSVL